MIEPKRISREAVPAALEKALRYRLLNEPIEAESICLDVLEIEPDNQDALVTLVLALTDQFSDRGGLAFERAKQVQARFRGEYDRAYYAAIINERWGKAQLAQGVPAEVAFGWFRTAMQGYERAEALSDTHDPDPVLRWNTCVRLLQRHQQLQSTPQSMTRDVDSEYANEVPLAGGE
jgi:hypothetical protein